MVQEYPLQQRYYIIDPVSTKRQKQASSIQPKSAPTVFFLTKICPEREWRTGDLLVTDAEDFFCGKITLPQKVTSKKSKKINGNPQRRRRIHISLIRKKQKMARIVIPPTRVDYSNLEKISVDIFLETKMMDQIQRKNTKMRWKRDRRKIDNDSNHVHV